MLELTSLRTVHVCSRGISGCSSLLYTRPGQEAAGREPLHQQQQQRRPAENVVLKQPNVVRRGGSGCDNLLSTGAGQDAAGRHLLQQKGLSEAAAAARAHRGYMHWVHGQMMIVAFVGLVPLGVWMAYARRTLPSATWFQAHRAVQVRPSVW